jgi:hypothetical protein
MRDLKCGIGRNTCHARGGTSIRFNLPCSWVIVPVQKHANCCKLRSVCTSSSCFECCRATEPLDWGGMVSKSGLGGL